MHEVERLQTVAVDDGPLTRVDALEHLDDHADVCPLVIHARSIDVHVPEADPVEAVLFVERAKELLARKLRRAVERAVVERMLLGHRNGNCIPVHRGR